MGIVPPLNREVTFLKGVAFAEFPRIDAEFASHNIGVRLDRKGHIGYA